jgi:hypothetical protein
MPRLSILVVDGKEIVSVFVGRCHSCLDRGFSQAAE